MSGINHQNVYPSIDQSHCPFPALFANTNSGSVFSRDDGPSELHLLVMPGSVRFPAPNPQPGFAVRVFACTGTSARGVPIRGGTLEILGFEGSPADAGSLDESE